eukprot:gene1091-1028_t
MVEVDEHINAEENVADQKIEQNPKKKTLHLPKGSRVLTFPRRDGIQGCFDTTLTFVLWHYPFWGLAGFCVWFVAVYTDFLPLPVGMLLAGGYWFQLFFYNPQYDEGFELYDYFLFSPLMHCFLHYLSATLIREGPPTDPRRKVMIAMAPHGMLGICRGGFTGTAAQELYPGVEGLRWGSFGMAYKIPGIREFSLLAGAVDAGKATLVKREQDGESLALLPGGIQEMLLTDGTSNVTKLCLKGRYGFVKLAKEQDMLLIPTFCFGEKWTCHKVLLPFWKTLHKFRLAGALFFGRWGTLLPEIEKPVAWVYSEAIETRGREIEDIHAEFCKRLEETFERNKETFGYSADERLEFLEVTKRKTE